MTLSPGFESYTIYTFSMVHPTRFLDSRILHNKSFVGFKAIGYALTFVRNSREDIYCILYVKITPPLNIIDNRLKGRVKY